MLAVSMQCWWMVRALRSHDRRRLVISSDEMSPCASRSQTSVTDRRLILTCQPCRTTRKIFASSVERIPFCGVVDNKKGCSYQTAKFVDNRFTSWYNRFSCFLLWVPQTFYSSATTKLCGVITRLQCVV